MKASSRILSASLAAISWVHVATTPTWSASVDPILMSLPQNASAEKNPIALSAVFDESLVNSPRVSNIRAQLGVAKAARAQATVLPNPSIFVLDDTAQIARQIGVLLPIEPPWKLVMRLLAAKNQIKETELEIARSLWQFRGTVRRAYLDIVMADEVMKINLELTKLAMELQQVAQKRFAAGDVAALDIRRAELAVLKATADYKQSAKRAQQAKQRLIIMMGRQYSETIEVLHLPAVALRGTSNELLPDFTKPIEAASFFLEESKKHRLEFKIIKQKILANAANLRVAKANRYPNPVVSSGYSYSGNPPLPSTATKGFYIAVNQELPILNRNQGEIARLKALARQLSMEWNATENEVTEQVLTAYQQLAAARERVELFQYQILPSAEEVARMARRSYEVGQGDINSTLAAQQDNVQTTTVYLEAVRNYQEALTNLEQAVGRPL